MFIIEEIVVTNRLFDCLIDERGRYQTDHVDCFQLEISDLSQLSDGRIVFHLSVKDDKDLNRIKLDSTSDGRFDMTPLRSVIEGKRLTEQGLYNDYYVIDVSTNNPNLEAYGSASEITSVYAGVADDGIMIWEEGMDLPAASEELEKLFQVRVER